MKKIILCIISLGLLLTAVFSLANFQWYYHVWDTRYYEKIQDAYLMQFPQAREVSLEHNYLTTITLKCKDFFSLPNAQIYINEHQVSDFRDGQVTLVVKEGDRIYIDTSYYKRDLDFIVVSTTGGVIFPKDEQEFTLAPQNNLIGEIKIDFPNQREEL